MDHKNNPECVDLNETLSPLTQGLTSAFIVLGNTFKEIAMVFVESLEDALTR